jgi:hypothetical protein
LTPSANSTWTFMKFGVKRSAFLLGTSPHGFRRRFPSRCEAAAYALGAAPLCPSELRDVRSPAPSPPFSLAVLSGAGPGVGQVGRTASGLVGWLDLFARGWGSGVGPGVGGVRRTASGLVP